MAGQCESSTMVVQWFCHHNGLVVDAAVHSHRCTIVRQCTVDGTKLPRFPTSPTDPESAWDDTQEEEGSLVPSSANTVPDVILLSLHLNGWRGGGGEGGGGHHAA